MLMGNRRPRMSGQNWFIVLNPLKSELERAKTAREISRAFRIPADEALDLVANTPIILLDNLSYAIALQVKQYFSAVASDLIVSNDGALKRRCYRTVWPTPPDLIFLRETKSKEPPKPESEALGEDAAIQEIRSWVQTQDGASEKETMMNGATARSDRHFRTLLEEERERLLKENLGLRDNINQIHRALEKSQIEMQARDKALEIVQNEKKQKEKEVQEIQVLLAHAEEKHESLREEFRQTRQYFEEKIKANEKRSEELLKQIEERDFASRELIEEKQMLQKSFHMAKSDILRARDDQERSEKESRERIAALMREIETQKKIVVELNEKIALIEEGKRFVQTSEQRLQKDLKNQEQMTKRWEAKAFELEHESLKMRETFEAQMKTWQVRLAQLEAREHELEKARRQARDLQQQLDQRESVQRRRELNDAHSAKEAQLKGLVKQQEKLEGEIRHREEELRKLLHEQEAVERELIEIKQAQRHLADKAKKESLPRPLTDLSTTSDSDIFPPQTLPETRHD